MRNDRKLKYCSAKVNFEQVLFGALSMAFIFLSFFAVIMVIVTVTDEEEKLYVMAEIILFAMYIFLITIRVLQRFLRARFAIKLDKLFQRDEDGKKKLHEKYAVIHCPSCSAPNAVRIGFEGECRYCCSHLI